MAQAHMIASDDNNPNFVGAKNPDQALIVRFYSMPVQNEFETEKQGRPIYADLDMVEIMAAGDPLSVINQPVREDHKKRFPLHWAHYMNKHGGDPREIGTPLSAWPRLTPAAVEELRGLKFYTVESIANAPDAALQRLNMVAGMSAYAFRDHAIRFLAVARDDSAAQAAEAKSKALEEENKKLREESDAKIAALRQEMQESLAAQVAAAVAAATTPKKRGRPAKVPA